MPQSDPDQGIEIKNDAVEPLDKYKNDEDETIVECQVFIIEVTAEDKPIVCYDRGQHLINQTRVEDGLDTEDPWRSIEDQVYMRLRGAVGHLRYNLATHEWEYIRPAQSEYHPS